MPLYYLYLLIVFNLLFFPFTTKGQQLMPTEKLAVITIQLQDVVEQEGAANKEIVLQDMNSDKFYLTKTNAQGEGAIQLPINKDYTIHLKTAKNYSSLHIPNTPFARYNVPLHFQSSPPKDFEKSVKIPVFLQLIKEDHSPSFINKKGLLIHNQSGHRISFQCNDLGLVELPLAIHSSYTLHFEDAPNYYRFELPNSVYSKWTEEIIYSPKTCCPIFPQLDSALVNIYCSNLDGAPLVDEPFYLESISGKRYEGRSNAKGVVQLLLPLQEEFWCNTPFNHHFKKINTIPQGNEDLIEHHIHFQSISYKEHQERAELRRRLKARKDSVARIHREARQYLVDSLNRLKIKKTEREITRIIKEDRPTPLGLKTFYVRKIIRAKVEHHRQSLERDPKHFEKHKKPILAVLQRMRNRWKGKVIVTDLTESMDTYMEEVLIWHTLQAQQGYENSYLFFNDGDNKSEFKKKIGETGGFYACSGTYQELDSIYKCMQKAIDNLKRGGEPEENDIEAICQGQLQKTPEQELILIADCYSHIRDIRLLKEVQVPVRIILCGAVNPHPLYKKYKAKLNEQYLTIAHRTGGSIHTLEQDIWDLSKKKDGETIQIGSDHYILRNQQFVRYTK